MTEHFRRSLIDLFPNDTQWSELEPSRYAHDSQPIAPRDPLSTTDSSKPSVCARTGKTTVVDVQESPANIARLERSTVDIPVADELYARLSVIGPKRLWLAGGGASTRHLSSGVTNQGDQDVPRKPETLEENVSKLDKDELDKWLFQVHEETESEAAAMNCTETR